MSVGNHTSHVKGASRFATRVSDRGERYRVCLECLLKEREDYTCIPMSLVLLFPTAKRYALSWRKPDWLSTPWWSRSPRPSGTEKHSRPRGRWGRGLQILHSRPLKSQRHSPLCTAHNITYIFPPTP